MKDLELSRDAGVLLQPTRYKIIKALKGGRNRSMYIDEIARKIGEKPRLTSFHLAMLERDGFLESEWREIRKPIASGRAGRFFKLTHKVDDVIAELRSELEVIQ